MGIRFYCPNGHKLNVKENLAGKTGFCPECGARLVIPFHSTRKSSREAKAEGIPDANAGNVVGEPIPSASGEAAPPFGETNQNPETPVAAPMADEPGMNPILRDQTVVWYIQVPGGPQYGPATGQVIHSWIQQRRVSANMLVWREGWANWLEAKDVFPELE